MDKDRLKALEIARKQIEHQFGKGAIMRLGERAAQMDVEVIPTGSLSLDAALGIGGLPRGRVVEIFGPEGSGKTTLALHVAAEAQKRGGIVAFIDAEHALDPTYAEKLGVNTENIFISQPDSGEDALEIAEVLVRSNAIDLIIVDSVAALVPRAELEGEMGDAHVGLQARLMSQALRKLTASINRSKTCTIFINQLRMKIGVLFGNPETTPGGRALKFYSSIRLDIRKISSITKGDEQIGNRVKVTVVKNKLAPPFRKAEFDIIFGEGISQEGCILDLGSQTGVIKKTGAWYSYGDIQLGQGKERAREFLKDPKNKSLRDEIEKKIKEKLGLARKERAEEKEKVSEVKN
ncbi:MAG TPA: recombinase RecA [Candidatus Aerophobetes bacterium]|uniref:Protein RecA n=1 Tax=Aerophobetes bacterium TaxID=2030807 RepID=A0A7V5LZ66_UNCAE|nr:recombinase RecA [Candidatus Aerophobetes bacterium]